MFKATHFKKEISNDSFKNKIYLFDKYIEMAMEIHRNESSNPLFGIKEAIPFTQFILGLEKIPNIQVSLNNLESTSTCNVYRKEIKFSNFHANNQEVALHELAHYFDALFGVTKLPDHHIGFLSAFEYLLSKYNLINKGSISKLAKIYYEKTGTKLPFVKDYYKVFDISELEYSQELDHLTAENKKLKPKINHRFSVQDTLISKFVFNETDHYVNLICIKNNKKQNVRFIKVIVKKLGFELKEDKKVDTQMVISPKFTMYQDHFGRIEKTRAKNFISHSGFAFKSPDNKLEFGLFCDVLQQTNTLSKLDTDVYSIYIKHNNTIFLGFDYYYFNHEDVLSIIKELKNELKKKRIHYYQAKSIEDFSISCSGDRLFLC